MRAFIGFIVVTALTLTQAATLPRNNQANGDLKERNIVGEILGALNGGGQRNNNNNNNNNAALTVTETIRETITVSAGAGNFSHTPPAAAVTDGPQVITVHMPLPPVTVTLTMMQPCPVAAPPAAQQPHQGVLPVPLPNQPAPVESAPPAASSSSGLPEPPPPPPPRPPVEIPSSPPPPPPPVETSSAAPAAPSAPPAALPPLEPLSPPPAASTSSVAPVPALPITTPEALPILSSAPPLPPVAEVTPPVVAAPAVPGANLDGLTLTNELNLGNLVQQTNLALGARATPAA